MEICKVQGEVFDLSKDDSDDEEMNGLTRDVPQLFENTPTSNFPLSTEENNYATRFKEEPEEASDSTQELIASRLSSRNVDKSLEKAVDEIRRGGSLNEVASYYRLTADLIFQKLVSRRAPLQLDILTKHEETNLVKWILRNNKKNSLVMRKHLLEKVGRLKKVSKITPIFARSKFGRMWYEHFLRSNPEILDNDGVLLPSYIQKKEPEDLVSLCREREAVVILQDFRKQTDFLSTLNYKVTLPAYLREDHPQLNEREIEETESSPSDDETSINNISENNELSYAEMEFSGIFESTRRGTRERKTVVDLKPMVETVKSTGKQKIKRKTVEALKPKCEECQKTFCNKYKLQRHMFTHIPKELYTFSCSKCLKRFPSKYHFLVHLKLSHSDDIHTCSDCGKVFKHQTSLRTHFKTVHSANKNPDIPRRFTCDICKKSYNHKNSLEAHIRFGHLNENKLHFCNICKKRFTKRSVMLRHKTRHSTTKPLICVNCGRSFSRKYLLVQHIEKCEKPKMTDSIIDECKKLSQEFMEEVVLD